MLPTNSRQAAQTVKGKSSKFGFFGEKSKLENFFNKTEDIITLKHNFNVIIITKYEINLYLTIFYIY